MVLLSLDLSTHTGFAVFNDSELIDYGLLEIEIKDLNYQYPNLSKGYPKNIIDAAEGMAELVHALLLKVSPDKIIIENTVRGKNRTSQRCLRLDPSSCIKKD